MKMTVGWWAGVAALCVASSALAGETETLYLTGKGKDDAVKWDFMCSAGQNAGKWSTIGVPSNWELQGFGIYTYGTDRRNPWPKVQGKYQRTFAVPDGWKDKEISIVFEGVMTDTQVSVNGQSAGPLHAGGYYRFKYDITRLVQPGENALEVTVDDESATPSVNNAERRGDYWNYAGIYRPVYLEAVPAAHIEGVAIDARADGTLNVNVTTNNFPTSREAVITAQILDAQGQKVGRAFNNASGTLATKIANPKLWTAETPQLYQLQITLDAAPGQTHTVRQKFGFRTLEAKPGEGLFLNGSRIMLKGVDRHSFWPDSGRCLSEKISRDDSALIKEMNMNAVRCSHYPPDQHFLDACDELGIYVLDELAGWHQAYDTATGTRLVQEMVTRDVNHPSILFWDNGNEGGWNNALDTEFAKWDPQQRAVLHPWQTLRGIDTTHYPQYNAVVTKSNGPNVFFPTEMLHGLYDGGHGAGLADYWQIMLAGKASAGGFLWSLNDEDIVRTDKGGILDSNGNQAPDGILGPYREKEGSTYAVKEIWSPIVFSPGIPIMIDGGNPPVARPLQIENRFDFIDAQQCTFTWEIRKFHRPNDAVAGSEVVVSGKGTPTGSIPPHKTGTVALDGFDFAKLQRGHELVVHASDPSHREVTSWSFAPQQPDEFKELVTSVANSAKVTPADTADTLTATAGDLSLQFSKKSGFLTAASRKGQSFSFLNGPRLVAAHPAPATPARGATAPTPLPPLADSTLTTLTQKADGNDLVIAAAFDGPMKSITYRFRPNGWLTIDWAYHLTGPHEYFGVGFDYPEANVRSMRYLGDGPSTVYQNRLAGGTLDVWEKKYNNTMVGDPDDLKSGPPPQHFDYPIFKGFYNHVRWLQLRTSEGPLTALVNSDDLFVQVFAPKVPPANLLGQTGVPFPNTGISFLHAIPAMGNKFAGPKTTGPQGQPAVAKGDYTGSISLYFGVLP